MATGVYEFRDFRIDIVGHLLLQRAQPIRVPPKAFATLAVLIQNRDHVVTKEHLLDTVWPNTSVDENNLTQQISLLRKILKDDSIIETIPRYGYRFTADVREAITEQENARRTVPAGSRRLLPLATTAGITLIAALSWIVLQRPQQFVLPARMEGVFEAAFGGEVSPDGKYVAFVARSVRHNNQPMLFVQSLADKSIRLLPGTAGNYTSFFWNNDSRSVFFITRSDLMRIRIDAGAAERIADAGEGLRGTVNNAGVIVLGSRYGLLQVNEGGPPTPLTRVNADETRHASALFLSDGDRILFTITRTKPRLTRWLAVYSLRQRSYQVLGPIPSRVLYVHGHLLYVRNRTLVARPFDVHSLRFSGPERVLVEPVSYDITTGEAAFSACSSVLVYTPPPRIPAVQHLSHDGKVLATITEPREIESLATGHISNQLAVIGSDEDGEVILSVLPFDGREQLRLVMDGVNLSSPVFSRDDTEIYFTVSGTSTANIHVVRVTPVREEPLQLPLRADLIATPRDVSPDGRFLLYQQWKNRDADLWYLPIASPSLARPLVATTQEEGESARFSPDGRRVAFVAKRGSQFSVYVTDFPPTGELAYKVISADGWRARWSADGEHIYFVRGSSVLEASLTTHESRVLFSINRPIWILEPDRSGGFFVREAQIELDRKGLKNWCPYLAK